MSVTPKLHALTHHAPAFLKRFGSLRFYGEQALEAWHGWFSHAQAQCTADSFLGTCRQFVRMSALERQSAADAALDNGQRRHSSPGPHFATRPDDRRLRVNETGPRQTIAGRERELDDMRAWARGCVVQSTIVVRAHKATVAGRRAPPPSPLEIEFMHIASGIGLGALVAAPEEPAGMDHALVEEGVDPVAAFLLESVVMVVWEKP